MRTEADAMIKKSKYYLLKSQYINKYIYETIQKCQSEESISHIGFENGKVYDIVGNYNHVSDQNKIDFIILQNNFDIKNQIDDIDINSQLNSNFSKDNYNNDKEKNLELFKKQYLSNINDVDNQDIDNLLFYTIIDFFDKPMHHN